MKLWFRSRAMVLQSHTSHSEETVLVLLLILPPAVHRKELLVPEPKAWSWNDRCQLHLPLVASNLTQASFSMAKAVDINNQYFQYFMTSSYLHKKRLRLIDVRFIQPCILYVFLSSWPRVKHAASWPLTAWIWRSPHDPSNPAMKSSVAQWPMTSNDQCKKT